MTDIEESIASIQENERFGILDGIFSAVIAIGTFVLLTIWSYPAQNPDVWNGAAVASGVRPATLVNPGYWTAFFSLIYNWFGITGGTVATQIAGRIMLSFITVGIYLILREFLAQMMRIRPQFSKRRTTVMRIASLIGAVAFLSSEPAWEIGQCCSEETVKMCFVVTVVECFFYFIRRSSLTALYLCAAFLGFLTAESPIGLILLILLVVAHSLMMKMIPEESNFRPASIETGKWLMTFIFILTFGLGIAINCTDFVLHHGLGAIDGTIGTLPLQYLLDYWAQLSSAAGGISWLAWAGACFITFIVAIIRFSRAADEEMLLPYATGIMYIACGVIAFTQCAGLSELWFWTYFPVNSTILLLIGVFFCCMTLTMAMMVMGVDSVCRNHERLVQNIFGTVDAEDINEDDEYRRKALRSRVASIKAAKIMRSIGLVVVPLAFIALLLPGRISATTRIMLDIIGDGVNEIVTEAEGAKYLFTDGNLDTAIELESARRGQPITCLSMMSNSSKMSAYLRTRGLRDNAEDVLSFGIDTAMGLRSWIHDKPKCLKDTAAMMGFDLWKRDGKALPPMGGFLARPAGFSSSTFQEQSITNSYALGERILGVYARRGGINACSDKKIRDAFLSLQWRIARMCTYRSEIEDLAGDVDLAIADDALAKKLNDKNDTYQTLVVAMERRSAQMKQKLTLREGLQLALVRADFVMGHTYAETILEADPENADANFALGMYYLGMHQLTRAEHFLGRCLIRRPNEPAVYNNLAMIEMELGRFDAALRNVNLALKVQPDSMAIQETKKTIEKAIADRAATKAGKKSESEKK